MTCSAVKEQWLSVCSWGLAKGKGLTQKRASRFRRGFSHFEWSSLGASEIDGKEWLSLKRIKTVDVRQDFYD